LSFVDFKDENGWIWWNLGVDKVLDYLSEYNVDVCSGSVGFYGWKGSSMEEIYFEYNTFL
jgi:hypothetical protein